MIFLLFKQLLNKTITINQIFSEVRKINDYINKNIYLIYIIYLLYIKKKVKNKEKQICSK